MDKGTNLYLGRRRRETRKGGDKDVLFISYLGRRSGRVKVDAKKRGSIAAQAMEGFWNDINLLL